MRTLSALVARALVTVAAVSSMIGLAMSRTRRGFALKNVAAASAVNKKKKKEVIECLDTEPTSQTVVLVQTEIGDYRS